MSKIHRTSLVTAEELRDPKLYPRFANFHASSIVWYLRHVKGQTNALVSAHQALRIPSRRKMYLAELPNARMVMLDSGAISAINDYMRGKSKREDVEEWLTRQKEIVEHAWELSEAGVGSGTIVMMDFPVNPRYLKAMEVTVEQAKEITLRNAKEFIELDVPPGWAKMYPIQGMDARDYNDHLSELEALGAFQGI